MAFAILSTAIDKNPSATSSGEISLFVDKEMSFARALNFLNKLNNFSETKKLTHYSCADHIKLVKNNNIKFNPKQGVEWHLG